MDEEKKFKVEVDGKEVEAEILDDSLEKKRYRSRQETAFYSSTRSWVPLIVLGLGAVAVVVLFLTLFIWALPVLIPVVLIIWIAGMIGRNR